MCICVDVSVRYETLVCVCVCVCVCCVYLFTSNPNRTLPRPRSTHIPLQQHYDDDECGRRARGARAEQLGDTGGGGAPHGLAKGHTRGGEAAGEREVLGRRQGRVRDVDGTEPNVEVEAPNQFISSSGMSFVTSIGEEQK